MTEVYQERPAGERPIIKVESQSRPGHTHYVNAEMTACSCEATVLCRHIRIARIRAKARRKIDCAGCGEAVEVRDAIELHEGMHDGLHFFDGDRLCVGCALDLGAV